MKANLQSKEIRNQIEISINQVLSAFYKGEPGKKLKKEISRVSKKLASDIKLEVKKIQKQEAKLIKLQLKKDRKLEEKTKKDLKKTSKKTKIKIQKVPIV